MNSCWYNYGINTILVLYCINTNMISARVHASVELPKYWRGLWPITQSNSFSMSCQWPLIEMKSLTKVCNCSLNMTIYCSLHYPSAALQPLACHGKYRYWFHLVTCLVNASNWTGYSTCLCNIGYWTSFHLPPIWHPWHGSYQGCAHL